MRRLRPGALVLGALLVAITVSSCSSDVEGSRSLPTELIPTQLGGLEFAREAKAEAVWSTKRMPSNSLISTGRVYTVRQGNVVQGDVQLAVFKPEVDTDDLRDEDDVRCTKKPKSCPGHKALLGMQSTLGPGPYTRLYVGDQRVYLKKLSDLRIYLWFPPKTDSYVLLVLRKAFGEAASDDLMESLVGYQHGLPAPSATPTTEGSS